MKRSNENKGHFYFGRMASRTNDEFIDCRNEKMDVKPESLRWFCGLHDLNGTFICQAI